MADSFSYDHGNLYLTAGNQFYDDERFLTESGGVLYFVPHETDFDVELWRTDGTEEGTVHVAEIEPTVFPTGNGLGSFPRRLTDINGDLHFSARTRQDGQELWRLVDEAESTVDVPAGDLLIQVFEDNGDLVVSGSTEYLCATLGTITSVVINGSPDSEIFRVDIDHLTTDVLPANITINAGENGALDNDTLLIDGETTITNYQYTTGGPESGTIDMDGLQIIFTAFEPIEDHLNVTNRTFSIGTPGGQAIRLTDDGVPDNGMSTIDDGGTGAFESITFVSPTNQLEINAGDGDDEVTVAQLDDAFGAALIVNVDDGDDEVNAAGYNLPIRISGGGGNDDLTGGTADDSIDGGDGNDALDGGPGSDDVDGGLGDDDVTVDVEDAIKVAEGDGLSLVLSVSGAQDGDIGTIDWADGSAPHSVVVSAGLITAAHIYNEESLGIAGGVYSAVLTLNSTTTEIAITVENSPPVLTISGPSSIGDGATYALQLSATDPGTDTISGWTITWGDGQVQPITGNPSSVTHTFPTGLASYTVSATATDEDGTYSSNSLTVNVGDTPPVAGLVVPSGGVRGESREFVLTAIDTAADETAGFTFLVDFGDGSSQTIDPSSGNGAGTTVTHIYTEAGSYPVSLVAIDQSGQASPPMTGTSTISIVELREDPQNPGQATLFVGGSTGKDKIDIIDGKENNTVEVKLHEKSMGKFKLKDEFGPDVERIVVFGQAGDDDIKVHNNLGPVPTELYGGDGNDKLRGGEGDDYLSGGDGDDVLSGKGGRNVMMGGLGKDKIDGDDADDVLVGGLYLESTNRSAVNAIMNEWSRTDLEYAARVDNLLNGGGLNGGFLLNATTVFDDNAKDTLKGKKGLDWFMANVDDDKTDSKLNELLTEIELDFVSGD